MTLADFSGKKVALLGAGSENLALLPHLQRAGALVTLCNEQATAATEQAAGLGTQVVVGENYLDNLWQYDYLFRIAGMPVKRVQQALKGSDRKPVVTSPTNLFLQVCPGKVIGVTGTKGKGTTSTLIGSILQAAGKQVMVVGNIGKPMFALYDDITPDTYVVAELSSFQLEDVTQSPPIAVLLPIGEDHLQPLSATNPNYHETLEDYVSAKANITAFQQPTDLLVFASDSPSTLSIAQRSNARKISVGTQANCELVLDGSVLTQGGSEIIDLAGTGLRGEHVFLDAALATAVGLELGASIEQIAQGLRTFVPLPHRLQTVGTINDVTYVDDSYATAPDAAMAAISAFEQPLVWIGGGSRKGVDFTELAMTLAKHKLRSTILLGQEAQRIKTALLAAQIDPSKILTASTMADAVSTAQQVAHAGDVVLLSPACASLDMFKNAADRGEQFTTAALEGKNGQPL